MIYSELQKWIFYIYDINSLARNYTCSLHNKLPSNNLLSHISSLSVKTIKPITLPPIIGKLAVCWWGGAVRTSAGNLSWGYGGWVSLNKHPVSVGDRGKTWTAKFGRAKVRSSNETPRREIGAVFKVVDFHRRQLSRHFRFFRRFVNSPGRLIWINF